MTIDQQLHHSATHKPGLDLNCPVCSVDIANLESISKWSAISIDTLIGSNGNDKTAAVALTQLRNDFRDGLRIVESHLARIDA